MFKNSRLVLVSLIILTCSSCGTLGYPAFKDVTFGIETTQCGTGNASTAITSNGNAISVLFDELKAQAGEAKLSEDQVRCDLTLRLVSAVDSPTEIQLDVRGEIIKTENSSVDSTILINKLAYPLTFDSNGYSRHLATLPKGARELSVSFVASAKANDSGSALIAVDSLEVTFIQ